MLEVILLIAAVAIGLVIVMRMDSEPRAPRAQAVETTTAAAPAATAAPAAPASPLAAPPAAQTADGTSVAA